MNTLTILMINIFLVWKKFMTSAPISSAISALTELLEAMEHGYWEATSIESKDLFFDLISATHRELSELAKLSIQDHDLEYEVITTEFRRAQRGLEDFKRQINQHLMRTSTILRLERALSDFESLITEK